jgi:hypothetical protein
VLFTFVTFTGAVVADPSSLVDVAEVVDDTIKDGVEIEILGSTNSFMGIVPFLDVPHM